jgi:hypothetical protein
VATFLELVNDSLNDFNEDEISDVTSTVGVQTTAVNGVLRAVRDIHNYGQQWPFLQTDQLDALTMGDLEYALPTGYISVDFDTFVLIPDNLTTNGAFTSNITNWTDISVSPGAAAYTSTGNGRARLAGGTSGSAAITQSHTTITNRDYRVSGRIVGGDITLNIGTTSGGTEISSTSLTIINPGDGEYFDVSFTATVEATFISFSHTANANRDVDLVEVRENWKPYKLTYIDFDEMITKFSNRLFWISETDLGFPKHITKTQDDNYIIHPVPHRDSMSVQYDSWIIPSDMAANSDTPSIPDRYQDAIITGAKIPIAQLRSDFTYADRLKTEFKDWKKIMKTDLITKPENMKAV